MDDSTVLTDARQVNELEPSSLRTTIESSASSVAIASNSNTASHPQVTPQPQGPSSYAAHPSTASLDPLDLRLSLEGAAEATPVPELINAEPYMSHVPVVTLPSDTDIPTLQPSITKEKLNLPTANIETILTQSVSTKSPSPDIDAHISLMTGTRTSSTADYKSQYSSPSSKTLILDPTTTRGFVNSAPNLPISITQVLPDSSSTDSLLIRPTATPTISNQPSPFTTSVQTVTANTLGQYSINNETLTPGGVITVSGSKISLAPNASELIIGTSTEALGPSVSVYRGSGSNGTEVQQFTGHALGATDGLWSSSMMFLISFLLMLWM